MYLVYAESRDRLREAKIPKVTAVTYNDYGRSLPYSVLLLVAVSKGKRLTGAAEQQVDDMVDERSAGQKQKSNKRWCVIRRATLTSTTCTPQRTHDMNLSLCARRQSGGPTGVF